MGVAMTTGVKEIRALRRAMDVIEALCRAECLSLAELTRETALAKSTLRRILFTLENGGLVRCSLADGLYRANVQIPAYARTKENPRIARIAAAARPVLQEIAATVVWPSDIVVRDGVSLLIIESTRAVTKLAINGSEIGDHVDMASSAAGRAYLAFCPRRECSQLLREIEQRQGQTAVGELARTLIRTRRRGWAVRGETCVGATQRHPGRSDKLKAVAMPVFDRKRLVCCINLLWPSGFNAMPGGEKAMATFLEGFVRKIERNLDPPDCAT